MMYDEYLSGAMTSELDTKYSTDSHYLFKKHKLPIRTPSESRILGRNNCYNLKYNFEEVQTQEEAYILGLWFADGWVGNTQAGITLIKTDVELLEKIRSYICPFIDLKKHGNALTYKISSTTFCRNLVKQGCLQSKTFKDLFIPKISKDNIRHFIRGYFDGDGSIFMDKKLLRFNICSVNENFLLQIQKVLKENNIESRINCEVREGKTYKLPQGTSSDCVNMYRIFVRKREELKKLYEYLYKDSTIYLERKYVKFTENI